MSRSTSPCSLATPAFIVDLRDRLGDAVYMRRTGVLSFDAMNMERSKPPFRAEHVGSLIRPDALIAARERAEKGEIPPDEIKRIQQAAIRDVVRLQEEL